jgi:hypothetical protein
MADKYFVKGNLRKVAHNAREEVRLRWNGYREVAAAEPVKETPALSEAEMAKLPEAKDAEVVDLTEDADEQRWETNGGPSIRPKRKPSTTN